jgi:hypothetical protein
MKSDTRDFPLQQVGIFNQPVFDPATGTQLDLFPARIKPTPEPAVDARIRRRFDPRATAAMFDQK